MALSGIKVNEFGACSSQKLLSPLLRVSLCLGALVHLVGFLAFRVSSSSFSTKEDAPFVQFISPETLLSGAELDEQAALFDSAPLFIPGQWNAAHNLITPERERALQRFPLYQVDMDVAGELVSQASSHSTNFSVFEPADLLALRFWNLFLGIGQSDGGFSDLEGAGIFVEVRSPTGQIILSETTDLKLTGLQAARPTHYFLGVEAGGRMVSRPALSSSSGDADFDMAAYSWIVSSGLPSRLAAGYYEIVIFP